MGNLNSSLCNICIVYKQSWHAITNFEFILACYLLCAMSCVMRHAISKFNFISACYMSCAMSGVTWSYYSNTNLYMISYLVMHFWLVWYMTCHSKVRFHISMLHVMCNVMCHDMCNMTTLQQYKFGYDILSSHAFLIGLICDMPYQSSISYWRVTCHV